MSDNQTQAIEQILFQLGELQQEIDVAAKKRDESINFYQQRITDAQKIFETDTTAARQGMDSLSVELKNFYDAHPPVRKKSYNFAGGTFGYRHQDTQFVCNAEIASSKNKALADKLCEHAEYLKVETSVDWKKLKADLKIDEDGYCYLPTGELLDGLIAHPQPDTFYVKPKALT